jgi:hypothetical protein
MVTLELMQYVKAQRAAGTPEVDIRRSLLMAGWANSDINEALGTGVPSSRDKGGSNGPALEAEDKVTGGKGREDKKLKRSMSSGRKLTGALLVVLLLLVAGGAAAYFEYGDQFKQAQVRGVIGKAAEALSRARSFDYEATITHKAVLGERAAVIGPETPTNKPVEARLSLAGEYTKPADSTSTANSKVSATLSIDDAWVFGAEARLISQMLYVQVSRMPEGQPGVSPFEEAVVGKWFKFDPIQTTPEATATTSVTTASSTAATSTPPTSPSIPSFVPTAIADLKQADFLNITGGLTTLLLGGSYSYEFSIDNDKFAAWLGKTVTDLSAAGTQAAGIPIPKIDDSSLAADLARVKTALSKVAVTGRAVIAKGTYLPERLEITIQPTDNTAPTEVVISFSKFNQPVTIETPTETKPFADLVGAYFADRSALQSGSVEGTSTAPSVEKLKKDLTTQPATTTATSTGMDEGQ